MKNAKNKSVGRPYAKINLPKAKFTFAQFLSLNAHVTTLTLRKHLWRDQELGKKSTIIQLPAPKKSKRSVGRTAFLYMRRSLIRTGKPNKVAKTPANPVVLADVSVKLDGTNVTNEVRELAVA